MNVNGIDIPKTQFDLIKKLQKKRKWNRNPNHKPKDITQAELDAYHKYNVIADDLEDLDFKKGGTVNTAF